MKSKSIRASVSRESGFLFRRHLVRQTICLARQSVAVLLSSLLVFQPLLVEAQQIAPDRGAPTANQPNVGAAPNGVPLVDIVTPNGSGLSHNKYGDFNVGTPGLILNNHNGEAGISKLGGVTPGNPNLKNSGPASVILNEVTSGRRSSLLGPTEVYGGRADVIVANPNGITCDGCGFINTPRATLTTGTPDIDGNGRLSGFTVRGGDVTFGSRGGNFAAGDGAVDLFDIVSRRVQIDGPVNGKHLRLSAGRQKFNYATGEATALDGADDSGEFAIDGSALGAMQADRIKIVVTDKGAGVRMRGDMAANAEDLTLSADGRISLGNASARDGVNLRSKSRQVEARKVTSKKRVVVKAAKGITLEVVAADDDVVLEAGNGFLSLAGDVVSLRNVELTSEGAIAAGGISAGRNASLKAGSGITATDVNADGAALLKTASGDIALSGTVKAGGGELTVQAESGSIAAGTLISFNNMGLSAGRDILVADAILSGGALVASAGSIKAGNAVSGADFAATSAANGSIRLGSTGDMTLQGVNGAVDIGTLLSAGNMNVTGSSVVAQNVTSHGAVTIEGSTAIAGQLLGAGAVTVGGANIQANAIISGVDFAASQASSNGAIVVGNSGSLTLQAPAGNIDVATLLSADDLIVNAGGFSATNVTSHGAAIITGATGISGQLLSAGDISVIGPSIDMGAAVAGVDLTALASGNVTLASTAHTLRLAGTAGDLSAGRLLSSGDIIASATDDISANVLAHRNLDLTARRNLTLSGQSLSGGDATFSANSINIGTFASGVDFAATDQTGALVLEADPAKAGKTILTANDAVYATRLLSAGSLTATAGTFGAADVTSHGAATIKGTTAISGQLLSGSDISIAGSAITLDTAVAGVDLAELGSGKVELVDAAHALNLTATAGDITAGRLLSSGGMIASATGNLSANTLVHGDLALTAGGTLTLSGQSLAGGSASLNAGSMNIGTLVSGVDFTATEQSAGSLILKTGNAAAGQMTLGAAGGSITADQLISGGDLTARAGHNIAYNSLRSFASADLKSEQGAISLDHDTVAKGDISLTLQSLDLSNGRGKIATAGTLIVNADSADLTNSTLTFGGIALNLSGAADASNAKIRAVTANGGSGNIAISAQTVTTTSATALLAANDLTLTLASLSNSGQLAANNDLTLNIAGNFNNTPTGLVYAGQDGRLHVAGDLVNDQGAVLVGNDLTIAADAAGGRNRSVTNVSGLIRAGRDAVITTANLTNKRISTPTWSTYIISNDEIVKFELNPETWGKPLGQLFNNPQADGPINLYPGEELARTSEWQDKLYGVVTFDDGTSYHTRGYAPYDSNIPWKWGDNLHDVGEMKSFLRKHYPTDADGNIILSPDLQPKAFIVINNSNSFAWSFTWDESTQMRQTIHEQKFDGDLSPQALIQTGRNLNIDATILNNAYSSIEAGGNAKLTGSVLNNEGIALYRTVTSTCEARGGCEAYDANGDRNAVNDLDKGNSRVTGQTVIDGAFANIKAAGTMDISGFATVNNTPAAGSIAGGAQLSAAPVTDDPTSALNGLTAGGALFTPNSAISDLLADKGIPVSGNSLQAGDLALTAEEIKTALGSSAPKPDSGGFGGTVPGQTFLYETRAEFLDIGKFYGSGYFINRIGYNPDRSIPFLGDAYFENQLVDQQLRQLVNQGLGKGSFIPGSDAIEQMKTLLDRGVDYAAANGLTIGEKLSPEMIANLTQTMVWYEKKTVNGIDVLVPTVYVANTDRANLTVAGALISGGSVAMKVGAVNNSGTIAAKTDLQLAATNITATGGSFTAGNDLSLSASQNLTISAADMQIGGETFVKAGSGAEAGGNASLSAGEALTLHGADIKAGADADLSGKTVVLDTASATNNGSDNVLGTSVQSDGNTSIKATDDVNIIGSNVVAKGGLDIEAEQGSVNVVTADVEKKVNGVAGTRLSQTDSTWQKQSSLSSGGDTNIKAGDDILIEGSKVKAGGDVALEAADDANITVAQQQKETIGSELKQGSQTHIGSEISAGGSVGIKAGNGPDAGTTHDVSIIGSKVDAGDKVELSATDNVTIAEARDTGYSQLDTRSKRIFSKKETHSRTETETVVGSSISGSGGVDIRSGGDTTISASKVQAGTEDRKADLNVDAGGDLVIASGKNTTNTDTSRSKSGLLSKSSGTGHQYDETTVASELGASGNVNLDAGRNVAVAGSKVNAGENVAIAGDSVSVMGAQETHDLQTSSKKSGLGAGSGDGFYSLWGKKQKSHDEHAVVNAPSEVSAGSDVSITARQSDVNIIGSKVEAGHDIALDAARDVNITPGAESYASQDKEKRSGFGIQLKSGEGSASIGIGFAKSKDETSQGSDTNAVSTLKAGNDVVINAGRDANLQAAKVEAEHDVAVTATRDVNLLSAQDETNYEHVHEELFAGVTATVSSSVVSAATNVYDAAKRVGDGNSSQSIAMGTIAAINGYYAYDALVNGKPITPGQFKQDGPLLSTSISAGFQYQKNSAEGSASVPVPTIIRAGDTVVIEASSGDINAVGAQIAAGYNEKGERTGGRGNIALIAGNDINLISAQATAESSSKSVSGGVQINLDLTGGNFNFGKGNANGTTVTNVNTHVVGSGGVYLQSGNDTNLKGATVSGETVVADVGGDLNIESQLDTTTSKAKQTGVGGGVGASGAAISGTYQAANGDAAIVSEQSGIHAGQGGFDIKVDGNTALKGGLITSDADSKDSRLETGTLEFEDVDTHSKWKADSYGGGLSGKGPSVSPPIKEGESETGKALSAVSPAEIIITDPANQQQNIDELRRDTANTNTSLPGIPDLQKILGEQLKTQQLYDDAAAKAANMIGNWSTKQYAEATTDAEREFWKEGGVGPATLHAIAGGLLGGVTDFSGMLSGALGGASSALLAPKVRELVAEFVKDAGLTGSAAEFMTNTVTGSILAGVGGATGGTGAAYAGNAYQNNYLNHKEREEFDRARLACSGGDTSACELADNLRDLSNKRDEQLDHCRGNYSDACQQARAELGGVDEFEPVSCGSNMNHADETLG
ncbi:MAG: hypothetical protein BGP07_12995, partial [Rhizobiales bacterium 63-22]